jgi:hypothetical protein
MSKLGTILDQIDNGTLLLPEFQRGYVWNRDQVRGFMRSLYLDYPVGSLLVWESAADPGAVRGSGTSGVGVHLLLLDGQQRVTSLYGIVRGRPPAFFEGNETVFTGLYFHVDNEAFEFYAPAKMRDDPRWVDVTRLYSPQGVEEKIKLLSEHPETKGRVIDYMTRLLRLKQLLDRDFHQEKITGPGKTVDVVVDIFNRVNSGGTKLSKGDLALAKICADSPAARAAMREHLRKWQAANYALELDWLLRNVNAVITGRAPFSALDGVAPEQFAKGLQDAATYIGTFLETVQGRLGLDHDRVLMGRYAVPVVSRYLHLRGGGFPDSIERDRVLFWYVHAALWGRFTGSTETVLARDYETLERHGIDGLISNLELWRGGNLTLGPHDFTGSTTGSRFYPLLYLMTRVLGAQDLGSGNPLHAEMLGPLAGLQVHHIFPRALLYERGYARNEVNSVANYCFLTQRTNLVIGRRAPVEYLAEVQAKNPGALASQWIPADADLWRPERYRSFLGARQELLANAANEFLAMLRSGARLEEPHMERVTVAPEIAEERDPRFLQVRALVDELTAWGYVAPNIDAEIADPETGRVLAFADAVWPDGLQTGLGDPVVLELDPAEADLARLEELGYVVFTSLAALRGYVRRRNDEAAGTEASLDDATDQDTRAETSPTKMGARVTAEEGS